MEVSRTFHKATRTRLSLGQGVDSLTVEIAQRTLGLGHEAQRSRTALAERAFEAGLLA
jgi:hypothetical protein